MEQRACQKFKKLDIYSQDINLAYNGKDRFSTWVGTFFSIITFVLVTIFTVINTERLVSRDDPFLS